MSTSPEARSQSGLTIVELIVFIVIISVAVVAVLSTFALTGRASADPVRRKQALLIAEGFLEEVLQAAFTFCDPVDTTENPAAPSKCAIAEIVGPEASNARPYDNVNDYVARLDEAATPFTTGGILVDAAGVPLGVTGYTASLTLHTEALNGISSVNTQDGLEVLRATVRVSYGPNTNDYIELDAYRTRYAPQVAQ